MGIVPAAGLAQGIDPPGVVEVPAGTDRPGVVLSVQGTGRAGVPGIDRVRGTGPVAGTGRPWAGRGIGPAGIGRLGAGLSCGCS